MNQVVRSMEGLQLFGFWAIPYSNRVEIALKLKGVQYEFIEEDLSNKSALLLEYNPVHKSIPVLVHKGIPIAESCVILEYISETWKDTPLLPEDPYDRAMARFWAKFIDEKCLPALWKAFWEECEKQDRAKREACDLLRILENELKGKKFFGGDTVGLVDIVGNFLGHWLGVIQEAMEVELMTKNEFPRLSEWAEDFANYGVIKENLPPRDKLIAQYKAQFLSSRAPK